MTRDANHTVSRALNRDFATCALTPLLVGLTRRPQFAMSRCAEPCWIGLREQSWPFGRQE